MDKTQSTLNLGITNPCRKSDLDQLKLKLIAGLNKTIKTSFN